MSAIRQFADSTVDPSVRGFLHTPETSNGKGLILAHGAGGNAQAPLLVALAETFCSAGFTVLRINLPYRQVRAFGPPRPADAGPDRAGIKNAIEALRKLASGSIFLGGHSYGGRQCSMLCAELSEDRSSKNEPDLVAGLLLCSYPLHPPGKSEQKRIQHLPKISIPTLFVHGTRDPFGSIAEMQQAIKLVPVKTQLLVVENAGHDLGFKEKTRREELPGTIFREFTQLLGL